MKTWMTPLLAAATFALQAPAHGADVGVSIAVSQPGVYGRVDIGRFPLPQVVVAQPVIVSPPRAVVVQPEPVYLWVPVEHRQRWSAYCGRYRACGTPVYFVQDRWYHEHVRRGPPGHARKHKDKQGHGHGHGRGHDRD